MIVWQNKKDLAHLLGTKVVSYLRSDDNLVGMSGDRYRRRAKERDVPIHVKLSKRGDEVVWLALGIAGSKPSTMMVRSTSCNY